MLHWLLKLLCYIPIKLFVSSKYLPKDPVSEFSIDTGKPIVYVFKTQSISNLLALHFSSHKFLLPSPFKPLVINGLKVPRYIFLYKTPIFFNSQAKHRLKSYDKFIQWVQIYQNDNNVKFQIIPITFLWNRDPGTLPSNKQNNSTKKNLKLTSCINQLFTVIFNANKHLILVSNVVQLNNLLSRLDLSKSNKASNAQKLEKLSRMVFFRNEESTCGPKLPNRPQLIDDLLHQINVEQAIKENCEVQKTPYKETKIYAKKIIDEMAANVSYSLLNFLNHIFSIIWNHLYEGIEITGTDTVRQLVQKGHEIIYIPCHKSHMDYLLLCFAIFNSGLTPPHVASGINLNFWPFGSIIRRCGAFFLRRSFNGDKLYTTIFREYVSYLCANGYSLEFFIEGKRSRTGRLLPPKTGLLSMIISTLLRGNTRPISIVPVYLSYEHIMEINSYTKELKGKKKETENIWQIFGIFKKLRNYGLGYVNFGEPITISKYLENYQKDWRNYIDPLGRFRPIWLYNCVSDISIKIMKNLASAVAINGLTLCALIILSSERFTITKSNLLDCLNVLKIIPKFAKLSNYTKLTNDTPEMLLKQALSLRKFNMLDINGVQTIFLLNNQYINLTYFRNNILHIYIIPSIIMKMVNLSDRIVSSEIIRNMKLLYGYLQHELFLPIEEQNLTQYVQDVLHVFISLDLLENINDCYRIKQSNKGVVTIISNISNETLFRYWTFFTIIFENNLIKFDNLESYWKLSLSRLQFDSSIKQAPEFSDLEILKGLVSYLEEINIAKEINVNGLLKFDIDKLIEMYDLIQSLTEKDLHKHLS